MNESKATDSHYSYENFLKLIFDSRYFSQVCILYDIKFNHVHSKLNSSTQISFYHLLSFLYNCVTNSIKFKNLKDYNVECEFCNIEDHDNHKYESLVIAWASIFKTYQKDFLNIFNVVFEIDLSHCQHVFTRIKMHCNTLNGVSGLDLNLFMLENIKALKNSSVEYKGIMYLHKNNTNYYSRLIDNIFFDFTKLNKQLFIITYAVGPNVFQPEHWCLLFIDFISLSLFFYNSLAKENQLCLEFVTLFTEKAKIRQGLQFNFYTNKKRQQNINKLCAMFVTDFAIQMLTCDSRNRVKFFYDNFNIEGNFDSFIEKNQKKYIEPEVPKSSRAIYRFVSLKKIFKIMRLN